MAGIFLWVISIAPAPSNTALFNLLADFFHRPIDQRFDAFLAHDGTPFSPLAHGVENISAVRMKSMPSTASDDTTTVRVVA